MNKILNDSSDSKDKKIKELERMIDEI